MTAQEIQLLKNLIAAELVSGAQGRTDVARIRAAVYAAVDGMAPRLAQLTGKFKGYYVDGPKEADTYWLALSGAVFKMWRAKSAFNSAAAPVAGAWWEAVPMGVSSTEVLGVTFGGLTVAEGTGFTPQLSPTSDIFHLARVCAYYFQNLAYLIRSRTLSHFTLPENAAEVSADDTVDIAFGKVQKQLQGKLATSTAAADGEYTPSDGNNASGFWAGLLASGKMKIGAALNSLATKVTGLEAKLWKDYGTLAYAVTLTHDTQGTTMNYMNGYAKVTVAGNITLVPANMKEGQFIEYNLINTTGNYTLTIPAGAGDRVQDRGKVKTFPVKQNEFFTVGVELVEGVRVWRLSYE